MLLGRSCHLLSAIFGILLLLNFLTIPRAAGSSGHQVQTQVYTNNISSLLDSLLLGYDHQLRPSHGGAPTTVEIDIEVRSMGQISEMDMSFSMDCYFRQSWVDERLAFPLPGEPFTLSLAVLDKLWKPDTFIHNGRQSHIHLLTAPNKFIRLYRSGRILYSARLTINAYCPMSLHNFPMDTQRCPLKMGSFAYTTRDVVYRWNGDRQVVIAPDLMLSQFDLIATPSGFENTTRLTGEFSTLLASFHLQRHMGNFLIQVYGPCMLLVVLSWVSFWLNREATSDRISLGITTVLTMTFLGLEARTDLPKVSYSTALDLFVWLSYGFIFATIIEFAFVHLFTKVGSGEVYEWESSEDEDNNNDDNDGEEADDSDALEDEQTTVARTIMLLKAKGKRTCVSSEINNAAGYPYPCPSSPLSLSPTLPTSNSSNSNSSSNRPPSLAEAPNTAPSASATPFIVCQQEGAIHSSQLTLPCSSLIARERRGALKHRPHDKRRYTRHKMNSVSYIDEASRVLFPLIFLCINLLYWCTYLPAA
ncbi:gamma-aminobutyric acid receptor subunit alpha-5-like [Portunus trituberculatus]|uniref:gamma-aminobutyric acid receptor subunit alpha-5-like n=1 Tax=Portunus trituberculatus TaxID=210409 RepID=UPI001E1CCE90|nr:gamma-aminobutyric acid receptor subunit alpha-5-like [Portunus trituberculatus]